MREGGLGQQGQSERVFRAWNDALGEDMQAAARPVRFRRGELSVEVSAANGRVGIYGIRAPVRVRSSNGKVRLEDLIGDADVTATNAVGVETNGGAGRTLGTGCAAP